MFLFGPFLVDFSISFLWRSPCIRYFAAPRGLRQLPKAFVSTKIFDVEGMNGLKANNKRELVSREGC